MMSDPFSLFQLPRRFDLDAGLLRRRFMELSRQVHPDVAQDQNDAIERTVELNQAFAQLSDPVSRGLLLLGQEKLNQTPDELFLDMLVEQREQLAGDHVDAARLELQGVIDKTMQWLTHSFNSFDAGKRNQVLHIERKLSELKFTQRALNKPL